MSAADSLRGSPLNGPLVLKRYMFQFPHVSFDGFHSNYRRPENLFQFMSCTTLYLEEKE
jgi:hypothetical protein